MNDTHSPSSENPSKLWNKSYILVLALGILTAAASQMATPMMTRYVKEKGASLAAASTVSSLMSITALFIRPISGYTADRFNRKKIMAFSTGVIAVCVASYAFARNIIAILIIRIIHGIAFGFSGVANISFSTSFIPKDRMGEGMGYMGLGTIVSVAIGPNLGLFLANRYGYNICFLVSASISILSMLLISFIPYNHNNKATNKGKGHILKNLIAWEIIVYAMLVGLFSCGNGLITSFLALIGDERAIPNVTLFFTANSIVLFAIRPFIGRLLDKKGLEIILYPSFAIAAIGMVLVGAANTLWMVILAGVLKALGQGSGAPSIQAEIFKKLGRDRAGVASSTCYIFQDIGNAIAPAIGGVLASEYGFNNLFYGYALLLFLVGTVSFYLKRRSEKRVSSINIPTSSDIAG